MDLFSLPPLAGLLDAAHGALVGLATLLEPLAGTSATAAAIVLITVALRAALVPFAISQARSEQTRARLAPRLRALRDRHRHEPDRLHRETMRLYADEHVSLFAGVLPVLAQAPILGLVYSLFLHTTIAGHPNELLTHSLLGVPMGQSLAATLGADALPGLSLVVIGTVVALIAGIGEITRRSFRVQSADAPWLIRVAGGILPFVTAAFAVFVPLAAGVYLLVTSAWTLAQRVILRRRFPLPESGGS
jgi:YidC/Oxa1 family membrane protein insertase